ncbi:hypothetical protein OKE68_04365 [Riemerella anatipestifer]|uniref:Uncharacterized protein n=1 Tax=Riemerella anatipestifer TaxID=34085 RepID=A0AAP3AKU7_RIEAN|nr:hypothetical protein [Riemerella anatipestifer]AZZ59163.1 hypothetical protein AWB57_09095 [Riemerella anatipestifer]MBT0573740.1 hypothetical protein [Riemerella anatipestifer]MCU7568007.1 hypothetical protein [Riemerella anatipestifer]MCW0490028.1 hypothetical protein [Riemerella anatipestifer]MCW0510699.1 hypothetical protein [Riemerella anatipestifer]
MTLEEYYKAKDKLKAPNGLDSFDRAKWYTKEIKGLQKELSPEDLDIVLTREQHWEDKVASSHN